MEVKVIADVHTVQPSDARPSEKPSEVKVTFGAWCTPESTPAHAGLVQTNSNVETNNKIRDETQYLEQGSFVAIQKVQLFSYSPTPQQKLYKQASEPSLELADFNGLKQKENIAKKTAWGEKETPPAETPQSPVPSSPLREKKCKGWRLPRFCDPLVPIDPQGRVYITWLFLVTFCYSYNAWCIALRASFPYQTPENTPLWMMADYACDLVYLIDVLLVKPRLMYLNEGFWVDDPVATKRNYMKKLQYKFDVISLMPLDLLYFFFGPQMVILRFPRILKLQTFWEFHRAVDRVLSSPYVVRIGKTLFYIFYLIHLNACAYYAVSKRIGLGSNGWVYDNRGNAYIRCFYFATKTATSIGKNPKPETTLEYMYMTVAWLMGVFVFALLIGQIRDIFATASRVKAEYKKSLDGSSQYLRRLNTPLHLQRRVTSWFNYTWSQQRCFDESKILNSLPSNMKRDVALEVHMSTLSKVQLFRNCSQSLLRDLVLQLRPVSCLPGDVIVRRGDVGHHMYIIKSGECYVMSSDETEVLATLREGYVFGEVSLLGIEGLRRRTATVRSRGYSSLFALSRSDLDAALKHHKEAENILRLRADEIIRDNASRQAKQKMSEQAARRAQEDRHTGVRRGQEDGKSDARRSQENARSDTKRGQESGKSDNKRGLDNAKSDSKRDQENGKSYTKKGLDNVKSDNKKGQENGKSDTKRGQEIGKSDTKRGLDTGKSDNKRGLDNGKSDQKRGLDNGKSSAKSGLDNGKSSAKRGQEDGNSGTKRGTVEGNSADKKGDDHRHSDVKRGKNDKHFASRRSRDHKRSERRRALVEGQAAGKKKSYATCEENRRRRSVSSGSSCAQSPPPPFKDIPIQDTIVVADVQPGFRPVRTALPRIIFSAE